LSSLQLNHRLEHSVAVSFDQIERLFGLLQRKSVREHKIYLCFFAGHKLYRLFFATVLPPDIDYRNLLPADFIVKAIV